MAAALRWGCSGAFELRSQFSRFVVWCAILVSASATTVTQEPLFASFSQGGNLTFKCSHSTTTTYDFYWYRQLPGKTELQHLGTLQYYTEKWTEEFSHDPKNWLDGKWLGERKNTMNLHLKSLQAGDTGLYLCAAKGYRDQAYFAERGTQVLVKDPVCEEGKGKPSLFLLGPTCHKKSITLVCLAHGFSFAWPLNVIWERDGQAVPRFSVATEEAKAEGNCNFGIASRLSVAAAEWNEGHTYSCHVHQGDIADVKEEITSESIQKPKSGLSEMQLSLRVGQFIFLLLAVKSFAYGSALGIYTACRKKGV